VNTSDFLSKDVPELIFLFLGKVVPVEIEARPFNYLVFTSQLWYDFNSIIQK
jgi:hypothetical protein